MRFCLVLSKKILFAATFEQTVEFCFIASIQEELTLKHVLRFVSKRFTCLCTNSNCYANSKSLDNHKIMV